METFQQPERRRDIIRRVKRRRRIGKIIGITLIIIVVIVATALYIVSQLNGIVNY